MRRPDRPVVKRRQRCGARLHVLKASQPNEAIVLILHAKLPDQGHPDRLLGFQELPFEELDQLVAPPGMQGVVSKLDDRALHPGSFARYSFGTARNVTNVAPDVGHVPLTS